MAKRGVVVEVRGAKDLRRALREIEDAAAKKGMQAELKTEYRIAARIVEAAAKGEVKAGATGKSGDSRWGGAYSGSGKLAASIKAKGTLTGASITAGGPRVPYAAPIHWGWPSRPNKTKGHRGGPIAANRFLTRAAAQSQDAIANVLEDGLRRFIDKVAAAQGGE